MKELELHCAYANECVKMVRVLDKDLKWWLAGPNSIKDF